MSDETAPTEIQVVRRVPLTAGAVGYARRKLTCLARYSREPVRLARLTFSASSSRAAYRYVRVQAYLEVGGRPLAAQAEAATAREAIDALDSRLTRRLQRVNPHWEARRGRTVRPDRRPVAARQTPAEDEGPAVSGP